MDRVKTNSECRSNRELFQLFQQPRVEVPSFDIYRRVGNLFAQLFYRYVCEKEYTLDGLLNGAVQAAYLCGRYISEGSWKRLGAIMEEDSLEEVRERVETMTPEEISNIKFADDDVICSFLHLCCFGGHSFFGPLKPKNYSFITHVVIYVRKDPSISVDESPKKLIKNPAVGSLHVINITLSRSINPLGFWKIIKLNFFDPAGRPDIADVALIR
uniref:SEC7 domain-containing protein n=1 Tax=Syphacia muris TaxID=451379 RepID=A0A0N5ALU7_9BILA